MPASRFMFLPEYLLIQTFEAAFPRFFLRGLKLLQEASPAFLNLSGQGGFFPLSDWPGEPRFNAPFFFPDP